MIAANKSIAGLARIAMDDSIHPLSPGTRVHEFVIRYVLGSGGAGIVYAADHEILRETFVIKEFLPQNLAFRVVGNRVAALPNKADIYDKLRHKFLEEGQTLIRLARPHPHPNLVQVTDAFRENDTVYLCMRFEHGKPLDDILEVRGTLTERELRAWLMPLLDGLAHAHACGVWHRDIKPANIFIREDNSPLLIDFGAAHRERPDSVTSVIAQYTPSYAAPEQMFGSVQGPWTDIYSMAATCFAVMAGFPPPQRLEPGWQLQYHHYSQGFLRALEAGLQFDPKLRPQSVAEWLRQFDAAPLTNAATVITVVEMSNDAPTQIEMGSEAKTIVESVVTSAAAPAPSATAATLIEPLAVEPSSTEPLVAPSSSRRWLVLTGGLLGLSVLGGVGAYQWFEINRLQELSVVSAALSPVAPAPEPAPLPIPPPPAPVAPTLAEQLQLADFECATVAVTQTPEHGITVTGYLRDREQLAALQERMRVIAPQMAVAADNVAFAAPFCDLIDTMNATNSPSEHQLNMPLISFNHADGLYHEKDYLVLTVDNTGQAGGYLYLDFVDSNRETVHLFPTVATPDHFIAANTQLTIGARNKAECQRQPDACFMVSRPHGNNLIIATWSETPLFPRWRTPQSEPITVYLPALTAAIRNNSAQHAVSYSFFTTAK